jgi:hypothetical protein
MCRAAAAISNKDFEILAGTMVYLSKRPNYSHDRENTGRRTAVMELSALQRQRGILLDTITSAAQRTAVLTL